MKKAITLVVMLALCLIGCGADPSAEAEPKQVISTVSVNDCFLCGSGADEPSYWGQNNVGIISLNTFEVMPIAINRYDDDGVLIEKNTGGMTSHGISNSEGGFCARVFEDPDRGRASVSIELHEDEVLDVEKTASYLCQTCLDTVLAEIYKSCSGVGVINLATKEIRAFEECFTGFSLGDYYIDCKWKEQEQTEDSREVDVLVFYCPLRYEEE